MRPVFDTVDGASFQEGALNTTLVTMPEGAMNRGHKVEAQLQSVAGRSTDYVDGIACAVEKRVPEFIGE
jgi:hypothetical protein